MTQAVSAEYDLQGEAKIKMEPENSLMFGGALHQRATQNINIINDNDQAEVNFDDDAVNLSGISDRNHYQA